MRLLTDEELSTIYHETNLMSWHESLVALRRIAEKEHTETLKAVGEWLAIRWTQYEEDAPAGIYRTTFKMSNKQWESLKRGEMPE